MEGHTPIKILKVKEFEEVQKLPREMPSYLPQMKGEVILVVAPISQGKSNFITNWFLQPLLAKDMFDTIYFFSNTARQDDTSRFLIDEENVMVYDELTTGKVDGLITDIINKQKEYEKKDMPRIAIIFDDLVGSLGINSKAFSLSSRARHMNIANLFYVVQKFKSVPTIVRYNLTHLFTFAGIYNSKELISLEEEFSSVGGEEGFISLYKREVQNNKYNFLYGNLQTGRTYFNFDRLLNSNFDNATIDSSIPIKEERGKCGKTLEEGCDC